MNRYTIPVTVFITLIVLLAVGLTINPRRIPSPLIDKPAPELALPELYDPNINLNNKRFRDQVWVVNVWASWCGECRREHRWLFELAGKTTLVGLNKQDATANARRWLRELGNPYQIIAVDRTGKASLDWGVYGVPETFVMDKRGIVRYKHIGAIDEKALYSIILPLIEKLENERSS